MAATYKILGQSAPAATTEVDLYTVPSSTDTVVSSVVVCNRGTSSGTFRIYVAAAGASTDNKQYLVYDANCAAKETITLTLGITLEATDELRVYASSANFSFNAFGTEIA